MDLEGWSSRLRVFADATRVRLLSLLQGEELTVAELSAITQLAQPRVSTHLAKLKEAALVRDRRSGVSAYYRFDETTLDPARRRLLRAPKVGHGGTLDPDATGVLLIVGIIVYFSASVLRFENQ